MAQRAPISRLLVSPEVVAEVDSNRIEVVIKTRREWTKTAVHDAIIRVGLRHLDEVAELLMEAPDD
ncbi:hypothetical protein AB0O28_39375 [Microbispora sp. NPDC088329]|uniref:hypothetical protein n=1 Tax=Microbispora sp. NPDC088329 TaxID=3154869 RepID=UPI003449A071